VEDYDAGDKDEDVEACWVWVYETSESGWVCFDDATSAELTGRNRRNHCDVVNVASPSGLIIEVDLLARQGTWLGSPSAHASAVTPGYSERVRIRRLNGRLICDKGKIPLKVSAEDVQLTNDDKAKIAAEVESGQRRGSVVYNTFQAQARKAFDRFDSNGNGTLDPDEIWAMVQQLEDNVDEELLNKTILKFTANGNGLSFDDFVSLWLTIGVSPPGAHDVQGGLASTDTQNPSANPTPNCWVCSGSGRCSKWLSGFDASVSVEPPECLVCFGDAKYGLSTDCEHFFCEICIEHSLRAILESGQLPAFCPQCRADSVDAASGKANPTTGRIGLPALSFLQQRSVISKEFLFRFANAIKRADREEVKETIECPSCGRFLEKRAQGILFQVVVVNGKSVARPSLGKCPCGARVCMQCTKLETAAVHHCPGLLNEQADQSRVVSNQQAEDKSLASMANIGKPCPLCQNFIAKNGGCDWMLCGDTSHGSLENCLRNGGCGGAFLYSTLEVGDDPCGWHDLDGSKKRGKPVTARMIVQQTRSWPKCAREGCGRFRSTDDYDMEHPIGSGNKWTGSQAHNDGQNYCCSHCRAGSLSTHHVCCQNAKHYEHDERKTSASNVEARDGYELVTASRAATMFVEKALLPLIRTTRLQIKWNESPLRISMRSPQLHIAFSVAGSNIREPVPVSFKVGKLEVQIRIPGFAAVKSVELSDDNTEVCVTMDVSVSPLRRSPRQMLELTHMASDGGASRLFQLFYCCPEAVPQSAPTWLPYSAGEIYDPTVSSADLIPMEHGL
jgi:hypothetical protein